MSINGLYDVVEMEIWTTDADDLAAPARISIQGTKGKLHFIDFDGQMDIKRTKDRYLFTWVGNNECEPASGYGNFTCSGDILTGRIYLHDGYDSSFIAKRVPQGKKQIKTVNRGLLVIKAKELFREWINSLPGNDTVTINDINNGCMAYLIPAFEDEHQRNGILIKVYADIFAEQLFYWCSDEGKWPRNRTLTLFIRWFELEFHSIVEDLAECDIETNVEVDTFGEM